MSPPRLALTIGVNQVDYQRYGVPVPSLYCCENDASEMARLAQSWGCTNIGPLVGRDATVGAVLEAIRFAARCIPPGGFFLLFFAGHGSQVPDLSWVERDGRNETWCLYDGELVDHALLTRLAEFAPGSQILVVVDCCHSGQDADGPSLLPAVAPDLLPRTLPRALADAVYDRNRGFYDAQERFSDPFQRERIMQPAVAWLASCAPGQFSYERMPLGIFTAAFLHLARRTSTESSLLDVRAEIQDLTGDVQSPQLAWIPRSAEAVVHLPAYGTPRHP